MAETLVSERLRTLGIPTPRVVAAAVYPGGIFYRGDIVTEFLAGGVDLGDYLFGGGAESPGEGDRVAALQEAISLIDRLAGAGVAHPDLNVKNFLIEAGSSPRKLHLLDLDRASISSGSARTLRQSMVGRLRRSVLKWEGGTGRKLSPEEWRVLDYIPMS
jgi:3-deoxy-D-manno-octulosonic acid kinase